MRFESVSARARPTAPASASESAPASKSTSTSTSASETASAEESSESPSPSPLVGSCSGRAREAQHALLAHGHCAPLDALVLDVAPEPKYTTLSEEAPRVSVLTAPTEGARSRAGAGAGVLEFDWLTAGAQQPLEFEFEFGSPLQHPPPTCTLRALCAALPLLVRAQQPTGTEVCSDCGVWASRLEAQPQALITSGMMGAV